MWLSRYCRTISYLCWDVLSAYTVDRITSILIMDSTLLDPNESYEMQSINYTASFQETLKNDGIQWHFQPARAPNYGDAHKSEFATTSETSNKCSLAWRKQRNPLSLLFDISGILNSRPLTRTSSDPNDLRPLTPNAFFNRPRTSDVPAEKLQKGPPRLYISFC